MSTTYDPTHPRYLDQADVRGELTRVYDICQACRRCVGLCSSFPTLFELIEGRNSRDAGLLTPAEQDQVVDECFQCKLCHVNCPYTPGQHEWNVDFPRLMLRARAMQRANGIMSARSRATSRVTGRTDLVGTLATSSSVVNRIVNATPGSGIRKVVEKVAGVSSVRLLPPFARQRFSTWFAERPEVVFGRRQGRVTVFPTCLVEYHQPSIGKDLVKVYERNGIECELSGAGCCGAALLHAGDVEGFAKVARRNVARLAAEVRAGTEVVVPQPACSYVIRKDYPDHVGGPDATLVAEHTHDAAEYLMNVHLGADTSLDTDFTGEVPGEITHHAPCHLRAQDIGLPSRDLMRLTGADVVVVQQCSGTGGPWGLRTGNENVSLPIAERLGEVISKTGGDAVAGDCHLANTAITEQTGLEPRHPLEVVARAYGIAEE
jgi:glycerol-3-phosphate dehydrogenase subunit C